MPIRHEIGRRSRAGGSDRLIDGHDGRKIPLGQLAEVTQTFGPAAIRREAGTRRIAVEASVSGRDLGSSAADVRQILSERLKLSAGYFFDLGGRVESQARATRAVSAAGRTRPSSGSVREAAPRSCCS